MKRRIAAVLLILCLCASLLPTAFAAEPTLETSVDLDLLVSHGISLFKQLEAGGKYNSVVNLVVDPKTKRRCVGMGIMGWTNSAALQLLKWCATPAKGGDPNFCKSTLGEELYNEVVNAPVPKWNASDLMPQWGYWGTREFSSEEIAAAKKLLGSDVGIRVQNNLARLYLTRQAGHGWSAGIRTESALLYYCSVENHYGEGGAANFMSNVRNTMGISEDDLIGSLDAFHSGVVAAAKVYNSVNRTLPYRTKVYNFLTKTLDLPSCPDDSPVPFADMPDPSHWAYDAIVWAYTSTPQITSGTSATTFSPNSTVTRAEAMTFLWAAAGKPAPKSTSNPFKDVSAKSYYYKAVLWAVEKGITSGTSATTFSPKDTVTLAQMITFLWAAAGRPKPGTTNNPFSDISLKNYYYKPILWAHYGGILIGNEGSGGCLRPKVGCTRAYVVAYLYNYYVMINQGK